MVADGIWSSEAEHWHGKPKALGSNPGGSTFFPALSHFQRSMDIMAQLVSLWTEESSPSEFNRCDISH